MANLPNRREVDWDLAAKVCLASAVLVALFAGGVWYIGKPVRLLDMTALWALVSVSMYLNVQDRRR